MTTTVLKLTQESSQLESPTDEQQEHDKVLNRSLSKQPRFPDSRYFQIHFEYLETQMQENRRCLESMQMQMRELQLLLKQQG